MARSLVFLLLVLTVAGPATAQRGFQITPGGSTLWVTLDTVGTPFTYAATPIVVYRHLVQVYETLKIPVLLKDSTNGRMGHTGSALKGIGGKRMSTWLGCGVGLTGPFADTQRVIIAIVSQVYPAGKDSSTIRTGLFANAFDVAQGSREPKQCISNGQLELRIQTMLGERLAGGGS